MNCLNNSLWAIMPEFDLVSFFAQEKNIKELSAKANSQSSYTKADKVAVLPLSGLIVQKESWITKYGLGTSTETFGQWFDQVLNDESISKIIIDINSPGGSVYGVQELANKIRSSKGIKPIIAVANTLAASAAYWIGSQADSFYASPSADVGSIGVYATHIDYSKQLENEGIKVSFISAGKYKTEGNTFEPLQEEAKSYIQKSVDDTYQDFLNSVAKGRNVSKKVVYDNYGQGRVLGSRDALQAGMIDGIKTLEESIYKNNKNYSKQKAELELIKRKDI